MKPLLAGVLLLQLLPASVFGKYVFVQEWKTWSEAQDYCRQRHTDLAAISSASDIQLLYRLGASKLFSIWIGLQRDASDPEEWSWSGGGGVTATFWAYREPNNWHQSEDKAVLWDETWMDVAGILYYPFACFQVTVVRERKSWEEALEHCRRDHRDLASVASHTEMLLIQKELEKGGTSEDGVWTGLRMLMGDWLWVDGQPLEYQAWGAEGQPICLVTKRCGALRIKDTGTAEVYHKSEPQWEWKAYSCKRKLHFVCY